MKTAVRLVVTMLLVVGFAATLNAGDKFFYTNNGKSYYCSRPAKPTPGVFAVCDDPSVVKIDGVPTITTARCNTLLKQVAAKPKPVAKQTTPQKGLEVHEAAYQVTLPVGNSYPSPCDCVTPGPGHHHDCYPHLVSRCYCRSRRICECFEEKHGPLDVKCVSNSFYRGIKEYEAVVPVPQLCVVEDEEYIISPVIYRYDCSKYAHKCKDIDCDFTGIHGSKCDVRTCRVYKRCTQCRVECRLVKRTGAVLIAVRRQPDAYGQLVADVVLGTPGVRSFPEYASNTAIMKGATASEISRRLSIPNLNLAAIAGDPDLRKYLGPSQPCN